MSGSSPFLDVPASEWVAQNRSAFALRDAFPVAVGHTLVVPRRLISSWWEASSDEQHDLLALVAEVRQEIERRYRPDGFNVGFNAGPAAGQTVEHLHIHVIPRRWGDVEDPRGGIRGVIPDRRTWTGMPELPAEAVSSAEEMQLARRRALALIAGPERDLHPELVSSLGDASLDRVDVVVSFILRSGLDMLAGGIEDALDRGARVRVLTTDYLGITERSALGWLLDRMTVAGQPAPELGASGGPGASPHLGRPNRGSLAVRVFSDTTLSFHPKAYIFWGSRDGQGVGFVGSSNVSRSGLTSGIEWNVRTDEVPLLREGFERLWEDRRAVPLDQRWLAGYRDRQRPMSGGPPAGHGTPPRPAVEDADEWVNPTPTPIQREALDALESTRAAGFGAGLVVMATGLGKTWLAAFDSTRPGTRRVLFVAHREEILRQARDVFRRVRPDATFGLFLQGDKDPDADVVFAGVQSLVRHLDRFDRDAFDYVVVDEFHHAAAPGYRRVLDHFLPGFLLGLTATPQRFDGADLLSLCHDNLAFECGLVEGIDRDELVPFRYWGVPDVVDFEPIPWRNGRFDPDALTGAVTTIARAEHAIEEWSRRRGGRTLAFCASTVHADFMAEQLCRKGFRAVAVHSGESSAPRHGSIAELEAGELDVVCSVDVFNEGLDLPAVDTVLMLRPTGSPVVFMQQLGRGLRKADDKDHLRVIDFIGNHRSFLSKPRTLLSLGTGTVPTMGDVLDAAARGDFRLPDGCSVEYSLEAVELLERLRGVAPPGDALVEFCRSFIDDEGTRPTAAQTWTSGFNPASAGKSGGWFAFLDHEGLLDDDEQRVIRRHGELLVEIERSQITRSYKLVTLRALLHEGGLTGGLPVERLSDAAHRIVCGDPRLVADVTSKDLPDPVRVDAATWRAHWRKWPIAAWTGELTGGGSRWFAVEERVDVPWFVPRFSVEAADIDPLAALVAELVEYRLARYLAGRTRAGGTTDGETMTCRVSHTGGRPIVWLDRRRNPTMPVGTVGFTADGERYEGDFRKEALNVARLVGTGANALHALLRGWFGPSAGHPGTNHEVVFAFDDGGLVMQRRDPALSGGGGAVVPLFPTLEVACGAFSDPDRQIHEAGTFHVLGRAAGLVDANRTFVAFARGNSMDGGPDPVRHGDPLLFEWARDVGRRDLVGQRVLVEYRNGGTSVALKRLGLVDGHYRLHSDNPAVAAIEGAADMSIVARLVRRLDQAEVNPLATHIGDGFPRRQIAALHGDPDQRTNWQQGHVSLSGQAILMVTLDKAAMPGVSYVDHFEGPDNMVWSSQASTAPGGKKGREVLGALEAGTQLHLWVRRKKGDGAFTYLGLVVPVDHEGAKPMSVRFRLLTPLTPDMQRRFGVIVDAH